MRHILSSSVVLIISIGVGGCGDGDSSSRHLRPDQAGGIATGGRQAGGGANGGEIPCGDAGCGGGGLVPSTLGTNSAGMGGEAGVSAGTAGTAGTAGADTQARGGASTSGAAGMFGAGTAGVASDLCVDHPNCDDRNPCTADSCDPLNGCSNQPLPDGTTCSDGNVCTTADSCNRGICGGTAKDSRAALVSTLYSYGGYREDNGGLRGASLVLEGDRVVFADPLRGGSVLSLVKVTDDGRLRLLDQVTTNRNLTSVGISIWLAFLVPNFDLFTLGPDRFVLAGDSPNYGASVYDIVDDRIIERADYSEHLTNASRMSTVGAGDRFWRLSWSGLLEFLVSPEGGISSGSSTPTVGRLSLSTALSPDRKLLYSAQTGAVGRLDLSSVPAQALEQMWPGRAFTGVDVNEKYLVAQEAQAQAGGGSLAALNVYQVSDLSLVASFKADENNQPIGFALAQEGLLIEWSVVDGLTRRLISRLYQLSGPQPVVLSEHLIWEDCCNSKPRFEPVRLSVKGSIAVLSPWQQVLKLEAGGTVQRMITGAGHGGLTQVLSLGTGLVTGFDNYSSHLIDLSDPTTPRLIDGGFFEPRLTHLNSLVEYADAKLRLLPSSANSVKGTVPFSSNLSVLHAKAGERPLPNGEVTLDGEPGYLFVQGRELYQLTAVGNSAYRLRRRQAAHASEGILSHVSLDQVITVTGADALAPTISVAAADPFSRSVVIATQRGPTNNSELTLHWLDEGEHTFVLRTSWSAPIEGHLLLALAVARNRATVLTSKGVTVFELQGSNVVLKAEKMADLSSVTSEFEPSDILHFDGMHVVLEGHFDKRTKTIGVYAAETLAWLGGYAPKNQQIETAITEVDGRWLVGSDTGVDLLEPECQQR